MVEGKEAVMNVHCFYHWADLDGHCSAAIVRKWCGERGVSFVPHGVNYGDEVAWFCGEGTDAVAVIVDYTPEGICPGECLLDIKGAYGKGLVWIDHHKTALEKVGVAAESIEGVRDVGTAACRLAWKYFYPDDAEPPAVKWLGMYDVFDRTDVDIWKNVVLPFQYGMKCYETGPEAFGNERLWLKLLDGAFGFGCDPVRIREEGEACLRYERANNRVAALSRAYDCVFEGLTCCAMNAAGDSLVLDAYARPEHKMRILWRFNGKTRRWQVSLYENGHAEVDCGKIAARHGGGGHAGAAGFWLVDGSDVTNLFRPRRRS